MARDLPLCVCGKRRIRSGRPLCGHCAYAARPPATCARCGQSRWLKARGLCPSCLNTTRRKCVPCADCAVPFRTTSKRSERCRSCWRAKARAEKMPLTASLRKRLKGEYGLTVEDYFLMKSSQGDRCAICARLFDADVRPHVDHCHATGAVRGMLCQRCNHGLGNFRDNPAHMREAAMYIERARAKLEADR